MVPQGSKIQWIISVAGHQVIKNLSEPSEFLLMHLDTSPRALRGSLWTISSDAERGWN